MQLLLLFACFWHFSSASLDPVGSSEEFDQPVIRTNSHLQAGPISQSPLEFDRGLPAGLRATAHGRLVSPHSSRLVLITSPTSLVPNRLLDNAKFSPSSSQQFSPASLIHTTAGSVQINVPHILHFGMPKSHRYQAVESVNKIVAVKPAGFYLEHKLRLPKISESPSSEPPPSSLPEADLESALIKLIKKPLSRGTSLGTRGASRGGASIRLGKAQLTLDGDGISLGPAASEARPRRFKHKSSDRIVSSSSNVQRRPGVSINLGPGSGGDGVSISFGSSKRERNSRLKKGRHLDEDESGDGSSGITIGTGRGGRAFKLPAIRFGGGGITIGDGGEEDLSREKGVAESNYYSSHHPKHHKYHDRPARPKLKLKLPHFPKTYIESNLKLPPVKFKLRAAPRIKITTGTMDPLKKKPVVEDPNMKDIFLPPLPFPKRNVTSSEDDDNDDDDGEKKSEESKEKSDSKAETQNAEKEKDEDERKKRSKKTASVDAQPNQSSYLPIPFPPFPGYAPFPFPSSQPVTSASSNRPRKSSRRRKGPSSYKFGETGQQFSYYPPPFNSSMYPPPHQLDPSHMPPPPPYPWPGYPPPFPGYPGPYPHPPPPPPPPSHPPTSSHHHRHNYRKRKPKHGTTIVKFDKATDEKPQLILDLKPRVSIHSADDLPKNATEKPRRKDSFVKLILDPYFLNDTEIEDEESKKDHLDVHHGKYYKHQHEHHDHRYGASSLSEVVNEMTSSKITPKKSSSQVIETINSEEESRNDRDKLLDQDQEGEKGHIEKIESLDYDNFPRRKSRRQPADDNEEQKNLRGTRANHGKSDPDEVANTEARSDDSSNPVRPKVLSDDSGESEDIESIGRTDGDKESIDSAPHTEASNVD